MLTDDKPLTLGDPTMDAHHAELLTLSQAFRDSVADTAAAARALDALRSHAREHFAFEDGELTQLGGPDMQCHLDEHSAVLGSLDEVHAILVDPDTTRETVERLVLSLSAELLRWLPEHVHYMDVAVATARIKARLGGMAVRISRKPAAGA